MRINLSKNIADEKNNEIVSSATVPLDTTVSKRAKYVRFFLISTLLVLLIFMGTLLFFDSQDSTKFIPFEIRNLILSRIGGEYFSLKTPDVPEIRDKVNPVNGVFVTKSELEEMENRKLVVVSLNNHQASRPQFGLSKADLVLEVLAEGGITRYNAFYYQNQNVTKVGPIRSARSYMLEFFLGFDDPIFVHEGQASYPVQEKPVPEINTLRHISEWGINSMQTAGSRYRDPERIRTAGYVHALMTGFDLINKEVERLGWKSSSHIEPLKFKEDAAVDQRAQSSTLEIKFTSLSTSSYAAKFDYDSKTNTYLRSIGGKPDVDALDQTRIAPKTVIVEYHKYRDAMDGHSRIILEMTGEDEAFIFQDGKMIKGKWKKATREARTKYYDENNREIVFNRGQIWVVNAAKLSTKRISTVTYNGEVL